ncbi:hypothetical protein M9H77_20799 [Catharanthus roseus]|uniref:Uncharacterized protein n=1 Tax=Catharanthus roseus TaxID=4058 RepID=A0ACC0ALK6_CATRO|nr:hypothetical protein M9H77_20799 [Catharanthus roseus]
MPLWIKRAPRNITFKSIARCFHGISNIESSPPTHNKIESLWFIKFVCTLCIRNAENLAIFGSDYFRKNLCPPIAFYVIQHINNNFCKPRLAFEFFQFTRLNLNLIHSIATFNLLLRSLCQMGLLDLANLVVEYMNADGLSLDGPLLEFLVSSVAHAGKFSIGREILISQAQLCLGKEEIINSFVHNKFLSLLVKQNRVDEAFIFFRDHLLKLRSFCLDTCSFNIVIDGLCKAGQIDRAFEVFNDMGSFGCFADITTYNSVINGLCKLGDADRALELLREIQSQGGLSPDVKTYTTIISGFFKLGRNHEALHLWDDMTHRGIRPNVYTFNVLIHGFGQSGDLGSALKIFESMSKFGCAPDVITFTNLLSGYCQIGEIDQGLKLWDEMNARKLYPNAYTFSIVINSLCKSNRLNEARDLLSQLRWRNDILPQAFIYNPVIDGFCKAGNLDGANAIVAEMEEKKCNPDKYTFTILIIGHCMKGRMHDAIDVFNKMSLVGCAPDRITVNCLVSCLLKAGMVTEAYRIKKDVLQGLQSGFSSAGGPKPFRASMDITVAV